MGRSFCLLLPAFRLLLSAFWLLPSVFCLVPSAFCLFGATGDLSNRRAPGFALPDPSYEHYYDLQDYAGKVVLIDIMSTRCPHCLLTSTTLEQVKARYGDKIAILEVVLPPDNQATVSKFIEINKVTVPVVCDMGQMTASYFKATPATMQHIEVPHLFLIDKKGTIRNDFGYDETTRNVFEGEGLFAEIDKLLK
jgi:peroxiredoxin